MGLDDTQVYEVALQLRQLLRKHVAKRSTTAIPRRRLWEHLQQNVLENAKRKHLSRQLMLTKVQQTEWFWKSSHVRQQESQTHDLGTQSRSELIYIPPKSVERTSRNRTDRSQLTISEECALTVSALSIGIDMDIQLSM